MTLHRYFAIRFLRIFAAILAAFAVLTVVIESVEQFRNFARGSVTSLEVLELALLSVPESLYDILPLLALLASITLYLALARSSELIVTRAAGRSALRATLAPAVVAFLIGVLAVAAVNPIIAATSKRHELLVARYDGSSTSTMSVSGNGLWLRQRSLAGQTVIRAARASLDGTRFYGVTFYGFDEFGRALYRIEATEAVLDDGAWRIGPGKRWTFAGRINPEARARDFDSFILPSDLTRDQIRDSFGTPSAVPIWDLPEFIGNLEAAGFAATVHRLFLQMELAKPLLLAAMVFAGAAFLLRPARFGRIGVMVLAAVLVGAGLFFLRNFARVLGASGDIPVAVAAWAPPSAALLITLWLMLQLEDS